MADSLREQLLKSGIVKQVQETRPAKPSSDKPGPRKSGAGPTAGGNQRRRGNAPSGSRPSAKGDSSEMNLAKAWAMRAQTEQQEKRQAEAEAAEKARQKRERKLKLQALLEGKALNIEAAEQVRHFTYGGKIRRVYVDDAQLKALNAGELGVVQKDGHYLVVSRELALAVQALEPRVLALLVEPGQGGVDEDGIPDDLMW
ncbi:DUF2058 family protein [Frateuria aurantia]